MKADRILDDKMIAWAAARWCEGYPVVEIAAALNVCDKTVQRALKRGGYHKVRAPLKEYKG
jgi:IS30 family transposase